MINASLNWASIIGLILFLSSAILFIFKKSRNESINASINAVILLNFFSGFILFNRGWKLDPILEFAIAIIFIGIFLELVPLMYFYFQNKNREEILVTKVVSTIETLKGENKE